MMDWTPITEAELWDKIIAAEGRMNPQIFRLWEAIKIPPEIRVNGGGKSLVWPAAVTQQ